MPAGVTPEPTQWELAAAAFGAEIETIAGIAEASAARFTSDRRDVPLSRSSRSKGPSSSLGWNRAYAFTPYPTNSGSLTYSVQAAGCAGWNITIAASPFVRAGSATTIPASNLTLTSSTSSGGTGISAPVASGSLNSSLKVLSASVNNGIGTFTQILNLNLNVPGGTLVGTYTSTLTIAAAPGP